MLKVIRTHSLTILLLGMMALLLIFAPSLRSRVQPADVQVSRLYGTPHVGIVVNQTMEIIQVEPNSRGAHAGLAPGDRVVALYGEEVHTIAEARERLIYVRGDASPLDKIRPTRESAPVATRPTSAPTAAPEAPPEEVIDETDLHDPTRVALAQQALREVSITVERQGKRIPLIVSLVLPEEDTLPSPHAATLPSTATPVPSDMLFL